MNNHRRVLVLTSAFIVLLSFSVPGVAQKPLTVDDIFGGSKFNLRSLSGVQWTPNGKAFTYSQKGEDDRLYVYKYDIRKKKREILIDTSNVTVLKEEVGEKRFTLGNYFLSPDGKSVLLPSGDDLYLYDMKKKESTRLTEDEAKERDPAFSPDGKRIAYIKQGNIVVLDVKSREESRLTTEGDGDILVGRFDWVYEEEFGIRTGFFWSPDGNRIAYWRLDQGGTNVFPIAEFIDVHNKVTEMRYPKAGDANSTVMIGVVDVETAESTWMDIGDESDNYIPRIKWTKDPNVLSIQRLNRDQDHLELLLADVKTGETRMILEERRENGWVDVSDDLIFLKNGKEFTWTSDRNGYSHIYLYKTDGSIVRQLTDGDWEVVRVYGLGEKEKSVIFSATKDGRLERHVYSVGTNGKSLKRITSGSGWHTAKLSENGKYFIDSHSDVSTPNIMTLLKTDGKKIAVVGKNDIEALKEFRLSKMEFIRIPGYDGESELDAYFMKPADFDPSKKYPVLIYTYGGPGSQIVRNAWGGKRFLWHSLLTQEGYVVFGVDGHGCGARGTEWKQTVNHNLGDLELRDQVAGADWLKGQSWVDPGRVGIWGWSYGGYMTAMAMTRGAGNFKVGISVAPVTDWKNYDTIYTERFMDTPQDNPDGYEAGSVLTYIDRLEGKLLIVHGSSDDNVHMSNTMQLAYELQNLRKPFDLMIYPTKLHPIRGRDTRVHLYNMMTEYILENL